MGIFPVWMTRNTTSPSLSEERFEYTFSFMVCFFYGLFFIFLNFIIIIIYFTILYWFCHTSTWICHGCTCIPKPEPPSHLPPHPIPLGHPSAPSPSILHPASNLDWWFISYMILYRFQCHSPKSCHPLPLPQSQWGVWNWSWLYRVK